MKVIYRGERSLDGRWQVLLASVLMLSGEEVEADRLLDGLTLDGQTLLHNLEEQAREAGEREVDATLTLRIRYVASLDGGHQ